MREVLIEPPKPEYDAPWLTERVRGIEDPHVRLHNEIIEYSKMYGASREATLDRLRIVEKVRSLVKSNFEEGEIFVFGSTAQGLYLPDSDIDLFYF
jgi:DNA polymerase sigma